MFAVNEPWFRDWDDAMMEGIMHAVTIHGAGVQDWIVDYYVASALRDYFDAKDALMRRGTTEYQDFVVRDKRVLRGM